MALTKEQKTKQVNSIKDKLSNQKSIVFIDFSKVPSKDLFSLRKALKDAGCGLKVAKKTLVRVAFGQSNISYWNKIKSSVPGQLALAFGIEDEIAPARITHNFAKAQENLKILGGIFEGKFTEREKVLALAVLPSRNELLSRLVGSIQSPISSFARVIDKIRESKSAA